MFLIFEICGNSSPTYRGNHRSILADAGDFLLKCVKVIIVSDNASRNPVQLESIEEFKEETGIDLIVKPSNNKCHDRFIVIDYGTDKERIYICGSSSKDAGNRITTIMQIDSGFINHSFIEELL